MANVSAWSVSSTPGERLLSSGTYSLFFSLMLAPLRSSSSVTCFRLGCGEATAQCCNTGTPRQSGRARYPSLRMGNILGCHVNPTVTLMG